MYIIRAGIIQKTSFYASLSLTPARAKVLRLFLSLKNMINRILAHFSNIKKLKSENEAMKQELKEIKTFEQNETYPKKLVYESQGHKFYGYTNEIPNSRKQIIQLNVLAMAYNIEPNDFRDFCNEIIKIFSLIIGGTRIEESSKDGILKTTEVLNKMNNSIIGEPELKCALSYFVLQGEPDAYSESWAQKKRDILNTDIEARAFFLCEVLKLEKGLQDLSAHSVAEYLHKKDIKFQSQQRNFSKIS